MKVGSSTVTTGTGDVDLEAVGRLSWEVAASVRAGHHVVVVTSGAIACGWAALGRAGPRPSDPAVLQAVSAVGQQRLMRAWQDGLAGDGLLAGQVLLAPLDFGHRRQYLRARATLEHLWALGVVPVVNENDAVADEEIRYGDNDRLAALVAHLARADLLVLLTDTPGLLSADPRLGAPGSLIEEVMEIDEQLLEVAGGPGTVGSGGMASKLAAARMASRSGVTTVIADGRRPDVIASALEDAPGVGTVCRPSAERMPARKLWIAFALA
ncbi:MAG: glutamate 5-kinase, partial [Nitrososphaerales archaeon]